MILTVPYEGFTEAVTRTINGKVIYVGSSGRYTVLTAGDVASGTLVRSDTLASKEEATAALRQAGFVVIEGVWRDKGIEQSGLWVAAVAYRSTGETPGLWIETYDSEPTKGQVITDMYDEFCTNGEIEDIALDDFVRAARANIVILSPKSQAAMAQRLRGGG